MAKLRSTIEMVGHIHTGVWVWEEIGRAGVVTTIVGVFQIFRSHTDWVTLGAVFVASVSMLVWAHKRAAGTKRKPLVWADSHMRNLASSEFNNLEFAKKLALCYVIYHERAVPESLAHTLKSLGFDAPEQIVDGLLKAGNLVKKGTDGAVTMFNGDALRVAAEFLQEKPIVECQAELWKKWGRA